MVTVIAAHWKGLTVSTSLLYPQKNQPMNAARACLEAMAWFHTSVFPLGWPQLLHQPPHSSSGVFQGSPWGRNRFPGNLPVFVAVGTNGALQMSMCKENPSSCSQDTPAPRPGLTEGGDSRGLNSKGNLPVFPLQVFPCHCWQPPAPQATVLASIWPGKGSF